MYHKAPYSSASLLFNIFLASLFFILNNLDVASYANDNTPYIFIGDMNGVMTYSEK